MPKAVAFFEPITEKYISGYSQRHTQRVKYCYVAKNALLFDAASDLSKVKRRFEFLAGRQLKEETVKL